MNSNKEATTQGSTVNPIDFRFSTDFFRRIPDDAGIYWMQDSRRQILFVGTSERLRTDLLEFKHLRWKDAPEPIKELCQKVKQIDWNTTTDLKQAEEMKKAMVKQSQPPFNKKQKSVLPLKVGLNVLSPHRLQLSWGDNADIHQNSQIFGPFFGRNALHRSYSALIRWVWIVGNSQEPTDIPPFLLKPLLKNGTEVPINRLFFENQKWINSLERFLKGYSDLFIDYGLRVIEAMPVGPENRIHRELFYEDLVILERFFKRYTNVQIAIPSPPPH